MKIYISSGMTGYPCDNENAFAEMERKLSAQGHEVVNPAAIGRGVRKSMGEPTRRDYLTADILELLDCDAVVVFGDWRSSEGSKLEAFLAHNCGMPLFHFDSKTSLIGRIQLKMEPEVVPAD